MKNLLEPMKSPPVADKPAEFPFEWKPPCATDVRSTWDRLCPGWRERKAKSTVTKLPERKVRNA